MNYLKWVTLPLLLFSLFTGMPSCAQRPEPPRWIRGTYAQRKAGLISLGIDGDDAKLFADKLFMLRWIPLSGGQGAILFSSCGAGDGPVGAMIALIRFQQNKWTRVAQTGADCGYLGSYRGPVSAEILPLLPGERDALLIHNDRGTHGTGYDEHHLEIYEIASNRLILRFDALEHLFSMPDDGVGFEEFRSFAPVLRANAPWTLEDTCVMKTLDAVGHMTPKAQIFHREISWSEASHRFVATPFKALGKSTGSCEQGESDVP